MTLSEQVQQWLEEYAAIVAQSQLGGFHQLVGEAEIVYPEGLPNKVIEALKLYVSGELAVEGVWEAVNDFERNEFSK